MLPTWVRERKWKGRSPLSDMGPDDTGLLGLKFALQTLADIEGGRGG